MGDAIISRVTKGNGAGTAQASLYILENTDLSVHPVVIQQVTGLIKNRMQQ